MLSSLESMRNSKIITAEGSKLCPDKPALKKTHLTTLNISKCGASVIIPILQFFSVQKCFHCDFECYDVSKCRNIGGSKVSSNASLRSPQQNMEVQRNVESKTAQIVDPSAKQKPPNFSLKRKTFEGSASGLASLKPLKRLSQSGIQVRIHESHMESKTNSTFGDHQTSELGRPCVINVMELDIPSVMENDGNVEKAEAYAKELEDIFNVLRKKHEEAKKLLVRAIVNNNNNNNLLMLNHPIYEAKISFRLF
ncbi:hypothetical protein DVH24_011442 [Malus domestica]|uniref:Uncharacterized protein n=1 Tax=Malus domestica TaxID=3750 RepID=A0A498JVY6_MALDO|nr:hypothetical protein DVH24_011442 [Malus domestica]